jgi:UDP-N-acetylmuramyl pentapeptide phosphotransferase/UDP-N-acetylglucosamine-1-phosphate transferase
MDGLATGISAIVGTTIGILAYVSGNAIYSNYLSIMYIPNAGEVVIFMAGFIGALIGFLWFNAYPAQVFMGDTGSLAIGGIIGVASLLIRKELADSYFLRNLLCRKFERYYANCILQIHKKKIWNRCKIVQNEPFASPLPEGKSRCNFSASATDLSRG